MKLSKYLMISSALIASSPLCLANAGSTTPSNQLINVITSPLLGNSSSFDASDILQQQPSINEDLTLLQQRQAFLKAHGHIKRPIIELSGGLEGQLYYNDGYTSKTKNEGVNLSTAELATQIIASDWISGFITYDYNDSPAVSGHRGPSTLYLQRGFVTIGDLNKCPVYFSIGKMYAPFGLYSSAMVSTPVTMSMGRALEPTATLGYDHDGFNTVVYAYSGQENKGSQIRKEGGARLGYTFKSGNNSYSAYASYITNIADAAGMQDTGGTFSGFGSVAQNTRVAGADAAIKIKLNQLTLLGEYLTAVKSFDKKDMTFGSKGDGAKPQAFQVEVDYGFNAGSKPMTAGISYGQTMQALALDLPKQSIAAVLSTSLWKDSIESIEYRHDTDYTKSTVADIHNAGAAAKAIYGTGKSRNSVILQVGMYF